MMLLKSYIYTAVLYLPHQVYVCGWLYGTLLLILFPMLSYLASMKKLEIFKKIDKPMHQIASRLFGPGAGLLIEILQVISQAGIVIVNVNIFMTQFGGQGGVLQCATSLSLEPDQCQDGFAF